MADMPPASNNTKLKNRTLWFDGDSSYPADRIQTALVMNETALFVDEMTKDIEQYNKIVPANKRIQIKKDVRSLKFDWTIPDEYRQLDLMDFLVEKLDVELGRMKFSDAELKQRAVRVAKEVKLYEQHGLLEVLRVLIYVINTLNSNSVVWGVGRGSSVSSYVLYLIGVHDVDSVKYELDIEDFLH